MLFELQHDMPLKPNIYLIILLWLTGLVSFANGPSYRFKHLTHSDGITNSNIYAFCQDDKGFMWIATDGGLFRYDGYRFKVYKSNINDTTSLLSNAVFSLLNDSEGNLWVGTYQGLQLYDEESDNFIDLKLSERFMPGGALSVNQISEYPGKGILIACAGGGILINNKTFNVDEVFTKRLNAAVGPFPFLSFLHSSSGLLWIGTEEGLFSWDVNKQEAHQCKLQYISGIRESKHILNIYEDHFGELWIATRGGGIYRKEKGSDNFIVYLKDNSWVEGLGSNECYSFFEADDNSLWIGTNGSGINVFDRQTATFSKITAHSDDKFSLLNNNSRAILQDRQGNIWVSSFQAGVNILINSPYSFGLFDVENIQEGNIESTTVISFYLENKDVLWVGTDGSGLKRINRTTGRIKDFSPLSYKNPFPENVIMNISHDFRGNLWFGTYQGGLIKMNPETLEYKQYKNNPENKESLSHNFVTIVREDSRGNMWVGTNGGGLNLFDQDKETFMTIRAGQSNQGDGLVSNYINFIEEDKNGDLWIGTYWGLSHFSVRNFVFKNYLVQPNYENGLSSNIIYSLLNDSKNRLWVGTRNGLLQYDFDADKFTNFSEIEGLSSSQINSILEDGSGDLWIATDNGLIRFNPEIMEVQHFYEEDGLQGNEFYHNACHKGFNGEMFFGGYKGFNNFFPDSIKKRNYQPEIVFTSLRVFDNEIPIGPDKNDRVILDRNINLTDYLELKYSDKSFAIGFTAIDFIEGHKTIYNYKLEGFDDDWNTTDANYPWASYTNLSSGEYKLRVRSSDLGKESDISNERVLTLRITPPPWRTWWAFTAYFLIIILTTANFWYLSIQRLKERNEIKLEKVKREQTEMTSQARIRFFTNISHEIRTPLTLIIGPLEQLLSRGREVEPFRRQLDIMLKNARRLLRLINQLLDLRKIELEKASLKAEMSDFSKFVKDIVFSFEEFAADRKINFQFTSYPQKIEIWFDPDKTDKIIFNLLSNAFKYTPDRGKITVAVVANVTLPDKEMKYVELEVADNGIGIRSEDIGKIFNRFYQGEQANNSQQGWGLGLSLTHSFVKMHKGEVTVESAENIGTRFKVYLPMGDEHFTEEEKQGDIDEPGLNKYIHLSTDPYVDQKKENEIQKKTNGKRQATVLIIEDNKELRDYISSELGPPYNCYDAADGSAGLEMAVEIMPDIVISDIMMPGLSGVEVCKRIKDNIITSHIPVILLTAKSAVEDQIKGFESGADAYIPKPFNLERLTAQIESILLNRQKLREKLGSLEGRIGIRQNPGIEDKFISLIDEKVIEHLSDARFGVEELAREIGLSRAHLHRKMKAIANIGPNDYIRKIRMQKAAELLLNGEMTVTEISLEAGFNSTSYFSSTFKSYYKLSPKAFIEKHHQV